LSSRLFAAPDFPAANLHPQLQADSCAPIPILPPFVASDPQITACGHTSTLR